MVFYYLEPRKKNTPRAGHSVHWQTFCGKGNGGKIASLSDGGPTIRLKGTETFINIYKKVIKPN